MRPTRLHILIAAVCTILSPSAGRAQAPGSLIISPAAVVLDNPEATQQILVRSSTAAGDLTRLATYQTADAKIAVVDDMGLVQPKAEGKTSIIVRHGKNEARVAVEVTGLQKPTPVHFETQMMPIFSKLGCNAGGCHGKAEGKNGFKLSVFGFDPPGDHDALMKEARGRRVFPSSPDNSLMLLKATGKVAHGGGKRTTTDSPQYQRMRRWITEGGQGPLSQAAIDARALAKDASPANPLRKDASPLSKDASPLRKQGEDSPQIVSIEVEPKQQILNFNGTQQLRVSAVDGNGKKHCVTLDAEYDSNATSIATVDGRGWIKGSDIPGQAAILVRYLGHVTSCRVTIPRIGVKFVRPAEANFIDKLAWDNLERLGIAPSGMTDDATFMRRVYLDTIGTLPTPSEARTFLADTRANKRALLIDKLLERPEYADYWAMRWSDLLRVDRDAVTPAGAVAMTRWLRRQFAENRPYDAMVSDIVTARGNIADEGPGSVYKVLATPEDASRSFSQLFLGIRIQCAQCHHHPADRWGQEDYYALAGFFTGIGRKRLPNGSEAIYAQKGTELRHPRTGKPVPAQALGAPVADFSNTPDRRTILARWITAPDNPFFARAIANRVWAHYLGRGLVDPIDDMRATNPATNEPLLEELAKHMRAVKFDLKAFTRTVLNSRLYQLGGFQETPADPKAAPLAKTDLPRLDEQNFSHTMPKSIPAEVLLDAISQATGVPEKFNGFPEGYRAIQIWDSRLPSYFFRIFGRPSRATVCECERSSEPSIAQALHLMNSEEIMNKIRARQGTARKLAVSKMNAKEIIDELYLGTLSRFPREQEQALMLRVFADAGADRQAAVEDVLWALLNMRSFVYNH